MKKLFAILLLAFSTSAFAQQADLDTPITQPTETKIKIKNLEILRDGPTVVVVVSFQDAGSVDVRLAQYAIPSGAHPGASVGAFITAMLTPKVGEVGSDTRKLNYRMLGYLNDLLFLPPVVLVP